MKLFFDLLKVVTGNKCCLSYAPDANEWEALFHLACKHAIVGVCADGISSLPREQHPPKDIAMRWAMMTVGIERQNRILNRQVVNIQNKFHNDGFRSCIFKGQGIAAAYYPQPLHRQSGDIDIWLEGHKQTIISYIRSISKNETVSYHHIDFHFFKDTPVEVHFFPSHLNNPFLNKRMISYWHKETNRQMEHRTKLPENNEFITTPTNDLNLIAILAHIKHHYFEEGIGLRQIMDYYYILSKGINEQEKKNVIKVMKTLHLTKFAGAVMYVLQEIFGMSNEQLLLPPMEKTGKLLLNHIIKSGNFGHYDDSVKDIYNSKTPIIRFINRERFNLRIFRQYPEEYFSEIYFRIFYYFYRKKWNG